MAVLLRALLFLLAGLSLPAEAAVHALLVAATRYDHLPAEKHLQAPNADVLAMRAALERWSVPAHAMRILGDGLPGAHGRPVLASILKELDRLAGLEVKAGDWVVIYLSGHGAIVRDTTGTQRSGLNSVFLPADVRWPAPDDTGSTPENALMDVRIGAALDRIRARGAHVWFVNDSCHSGDTVRSGSDENVRDKSIGPAPRGGAKAPRPRPLAQKPTTDTLPGRLVAFYAAQVTETAREFRGEDGVWRSAFTLALTGAMQRDTGRDARSLIARAVHGTRALRNLGIFQTPYADDDLAGGEPLLGGAPAPLRNPFEGTDTTLHAGILDGIDRDAVLTLHASATEEAPIAQAKVVSGGLTRSRVMTVDGNVLPAGVWFARLASPAPEARLSVELEDSGGNSAGPVRTALEAILTDRLSPVVRAGSLAEADLVLTPDAGRLRIRARRTLLGIAEESEIALGGGAEGTLAARLAAQLHRFDFLRRMERAEGMAGSLPAAERFRVQMTLRRFGTSAATPCPEPAKAATAEIVRPGLPLQACDAVEVEVRNISSTPRYVQVLGIHPDGRVQTIAPRCGAGGALKLEAGQATAGRQLAGAKSALPVVWFSLPRNLTSASGRMAIQLVSTPIDAAAVAPDPCQFERFNGARVVPTRGGAPLFDEGTRSAARPGEIAVMSRVIEWTLR